MGAHPWFYVVPYQPDLQRALDELRQREFRAGRYNPVIPFPDFPVEEDSPSPGAGHESIQAAIADAGADGTRSILDMLSTGKEPDYGIVIVLNSDELLDFYKTERPTRKMVEGTLPPDIDRGHGVCVILYEGESPSEICFCGYSYD